MIGPMIDCPAVTSADIQKALAPTSVCERVLAAPGTYANLMLLGVKRPTPVTITAADPAHPPVFTGRFVVNNSANLAFSNIAVLVTFDMPVQVLGSTGVSFDQIDAHGAPNGDPADDTRALLVRNSSNVSVTNSFFHEVSDAVSLLNSDHVDVSGNRFDLIRDDGVVSGGVSFVTVADNVFTNFYHVGQVHPDAIQFWTTNTTVAAHDIAITGNVFDRGSGAAVQGIFLRDQVGNLPFQRVTIADNVIVGAIWNGIYPSGVQAPVVTGNVVLAYADQRSWIAFTPGNPITLDRNQASEFNLGNGYPLGTNARLAAALTPAASAALSAQLAALARPGQLAGVATQYRALALQAAGFLPPPPPEDIATIKGFVAQALAVPTIKQARADALNAALALP